MPRLRHYVGPCWPLDVTAYDYVIDLCASDVAWEFLRRNPDYQRDYRLYRRGNQGPRRLKSGQWMTRLRRAPAQAGKWGVYPFCRSEIIGTTGRRVLDDRHCVARSGSHRPTFDQRAAA